MKRLTLLALYTLSSLVIALSAGEIQAQWPRPPAPSQPPALPQPSLPPLPRQFTLNVNVSGNGAVAGAVPIACPGICNATYLEGVRLVLTAVPRPDYLFAGWSGACSGTGPCALTMNQNHNVTANFVRPQLIVSREGSGAGRVSSNPRGISDCGTDCDEVYPAYASITLSAHNETGVFAGWRGPCTVVGNDCLVLMNGNKHVVATFERPLLRVTKTGLGTVTANAAGINCGDDCEERYDNGRVITLEAKPDGGFWFVRWEGECDSVDQNLCRVNADKPEKGVRAVFANVSTVGQYGLSSAQPAVTLGRIVFAKVELSAQTPVQTILSGQSASFAINLKRTNYKGPVKLTATLINSAGATAPPVSFSQSITEGDNSTLAISQTRLAGSYTWRITGTARGVMINPIDVSLIVAPQLQYRPGFIWR